MDPGMIMALMSAVSAISGGMTGEKGGQGSTYNKNQLQGLNKVLNDVMGMRGQGQNDITRNQNFQQGQNWLSDLFGNDQNFFDKFQAPMERQFSEQTAPELANRFGGMGSGGSFGTSFRNQANREGERLQESIAAMRGGMQQAGVGQSLQYGQQPVNNYMQMLQQAMNPTQNTYQGPSMGFGGAMAAPFAQGASAYWGGQGGQNNNQSYANGGGQIEPPQMTRQYLGQ